MRPRKYEVFYEATLIGHSDLEFGDPPMGVAFGKFDPVSEYEKVRDLISTTETHAPPNVMLTILNPQTTKKFTNAGGIMAFEANLPDELELNILGIPYPTYEEWFPEHMYEYNNRFKV